MKAAALDLGIPVTAAVRDAADAGAELGVVVAYGRLVPPSVLERLPIVNLHLSLLPRWRGAAPIERAILAGDSVTGVSIMALEEGLDTGGVYARIPTPIDPEEDAVALGSRLVALGTTELVERLSQGGIDGLGTPVAQEGEATYAEKITPDDRMIDFHDSAERCLRVVRIGRATTTFRSARLFVHRAELVPDVSDGDQPGRLAGDTVVTGDGGLRLLEVQAPGRRAQRFDEFARGARLVDGEILGEPASIDDPPR